MLVARLTPIEKTTFIPQLPHPYYNLRYQVPDFAFISGIYNPYTNLWLEGMSWKLMKNTYQTYLAVGQPKFVNTIDLDRALIWPFQPAASGVLFLLYKATAPVISDSHVPILPASVGSQLVEYAATADALEQAREFTKAKKWWSRLYKPQGSNKISIYQQAINEIKNLARADREMVLEPYRWIFHGGAYGGGIDTDVWISNEVPAGTIDGSNATFTLSKIPNPASSLMLMRNGQVLFQGIGYSLSGNSVIYANDYIPQPGIHTHRAWYQIS